MQRSVFSFVTVNRFIQPIHFFCMSASSSKRKVKNPRISSVSLPVAKKRKITSLFQKPAIMEKNEIDVKSILEKVVHLPNPVKSQNDKKDYRFVQCYSSCFILSKNKFFPQSSAIIQWNASAIDF